MWGFKPNGGRPLTTAERRFTTEARISVLCVCKKSIQKMDIPFTSIGPWREGQEVQVPLYLLDVIVNESVVEAVLPYMLHHDIIQKTLKDEMDSVNDLIPPKIPMALEVAEYFLDASSIAPWLTYADMKKDTDSRPSSANVAGSQASQGASQASYQGSQVNTDSRSKLLRLAVQYRKKVHETFDDWVKLRRTKIINMMRSGGPLDPRLMFEGAYPATVLSRLYQREFRWVTPVIKEAYNKLKLGPFSQRARPSEIVLASQGLDWFKCLEQITKLQEMYTDDLLENVDMLESKTSAPANSIIREVADEEMNSVEV